MPAGQSTRRAGQDHTRTARRRRQEEVRLQLLTEPVTLVLCFES